MHTVDGPDTITCAFCGDPIGNYEPLTVLSDDGDRQTSLAMEPAVAGAQSPLMHAACAWFYREGPERTRIIGSADPENASVPAGLHAER